ncbi:hypothetical protein Syun_011206 [Stephania yunnanensis]|uniref:Uncharacterized protein n=1 Tax=Stephania yunnanensis TaxID=152371 RepID=A0AAP0PIA0_9MAGN
MYGGGPPEAQQMSYYDHVQRVEKRRAKFMPACLRCVAASAATRLVSAAWTFCAVAADHQGHQSLLIIC